MLWPVYYVPCQQLPLCRQGFPPSAPRIPARSLWSDAEDEALFEPAEDIFRDAIMANVDFQWEDENDEGIPDNQFERRSSGSNQDVMMKDAQQFDITEVCDRFEMSDGGATPMEMSEDDEMEPEAQSRVTHNLVVRSQPAVGMAAGSADPVGGAAAHTPTTRDCYRPSAKSRGQAEAQVPGSSRVLTAQQLNSQKQNARRAKLKAASKAPTKVKEKAAAPQEGRILEAVADFWARKKAKAEARGEG